MARFGVAAFQNMIDIAVPAEVCASPNWGVGIHGVRCPRRWLGGSHVWARTTASPQAPEAIITASSRAACMRTRFMPTLHKKGDGGRLAALLQRRREPRQIVEGLEAVWPPQPLIKLHLLAFGAV